MTVGRQELEMYTAAHCLKKKDLTKMFKDTKQSLRSPRGEWHPIISKDGDVDRPLLSRRTANSPAAPTWIIEKRRPAEDERREKTSSLAARARALGFHPGVSNEALADIVPKK